MDFLFFVVAKWRFQISLLGVDLMENEDISPQMAKYFSALQP
jgi:hypothetical protein